MMSIEDLMKPRIKVIAPMPLMKNKVGDLLNRSEHNGEFHFGIKADDAEHFYPLPDFETWPYIFQILEWWEGRQPEEMPEYVKWVKGKETGNVEKVLGGAKRVDMVLLKVASQVNNILPEYFMPATEAEYLTYKSTHP